MRIKLNTNLVRMFSGTYETMWEVSETDDQGNELEVNYDRADLMKSIAREYAEHDDYILSELNCSFIKKLHFTGDYYSPYQYNFSTDELDFTIDVDWKKLLDKVVKLKDNKDFETFLHDHYTSYDGFMSFTPNNYGDWAKAIINKGDDLEQAVGALITFIQGKDLEPRGGVSIEEMIYEDWQGNGYNGLEYTVVNNEANNLTI